jgi:putative FmdB family regulatory protein
MPTYQYACTSCGESLEVVQKFTDDPLTVCPSCDGRLRKVFSAVGVVFKGSGFYKTDSRAKSASGAGAKPSGDSAPADKPAAGTSSDSGSSDSGSSDTAPATPSTSTPSPAAGSKPAGSSGDRVA